MTVRPYPRPGGAAIRGPDSEFFAAVPISSLRRARLVPPYLVGLEHRHYDPWKP
jgi:hypothetical protein